MRRDGKQRKKSMEHHWKVVEHGWKLKKMLGNNWKRIENSEKPWEIPTLHTKEGFFSCRQAPAASGARWRHAPDAEAGGELAHWEDVEQAMSSPFWALFEPFSALVVAFSSRFRWPLRGSRCSTSWARAPGTSSPTASRTYFRLRSSFRSIVKEKTMVFRGF